MWRCTFNTKQNLTEKVGNNNIEREKKTKKKSNQAVIRMYYNPVLTYRNSLSTVYILCTRKNAIQQVNQNFLGLAAAVLWSRSPLFFIPFSFFSNRIHELV